MLTPTTYLDAVNTMLNVIGESPINTLEDPGVVDAVIAVEVLAATSRSVLTHGWDYNEEDNYPFAPEAFEPFEIKVPDTALVCVPMEKRSPLVLRGQRFYNRTTKTYSFPGARPVLCRVVWNQPFEELPEAARHYITLRAARIFASRMVGDGEIDGFTSRDEIEARIIHKRDHTRSSRANMLNDSWSVARALRRF
jgi:hypothetical protein